VRWSGENDYDAEIAAAAERTGVTPELLKATIAVESGFNPRAVNWGDPGGAWGLMQMIPATARALGYSGAMQRLTLEPQLAIDLGTDLLAQNLRRAGGVLADSISAYNGGFRPEYGLGSLRPDGTYGNQSYVDSVLAALGYFQSLGVPGDPGTPPGGGEPAPGEPFRSGVPRDGGHSPGRGHPLVQAAWSLSHGLAAILGWELRGMLR
jgi:hypothetical protein